MFMLPAYTLCIMHTPEYVTAAQCSSVHSGNFKVFEFNFSKKKVFEFDYCNFATVLYSSMCVFLLYNMYMYFAMVIGTYYYKVTR